MPFGKKEEGKTTKQSAKELKQAQEEKMAYAKVLYGAGADGWTPQWYQRIVEAYNTNTLTIGEIRPYNREKVKPIKPLPQYYTDINILLSENKKEEELTDSERVLLMAYCHPIRKIM